MPATSRSAHLWPLDIVRLLTFCAVIAVHVLAFTELPSSATAGGLMMLLQFGREVFFALSGFVLVWSTRDRLVKVLPFWRRRVPLVLVPYLVWTVVYATVAPLMPPHPRFTWSGLGMDVLNGRAYYHLYFLLVTLQLYLVFPWLVRAVRRTAHRAGWVLGAVAVINLAWLAALQYVPAPSGTGRWLWQYGYELLPTYAMYVLAGAYAACHLDRIESVIRRYPRRLLTVAAAGAAVALTVYAVQLSSMAPRVANAVVQPAMAATCVAALIVVMLIGWRWSDGRRGGESSVAWGSRISFGVYLAHPLVLALLLNAGLGTRHQLLPAPLATVVAFVGTIAGSVVLSTWLQRTRLSLPLTGRPSTTSKSGSSTISSDAHTASSGLLRPVGRPFFVPSTEIADLLQRHSRTASERVAFAEGSGGRSRTWAEVWARASAWQGIEAFAGRRVGLCIANPLEMATCYLGALASGVGAAPLDPRATPAELDAQCARLGLTALVTDQPLDGAPGQGAENVALWTVRSGALTLVAPGRGGQAAADGAALILSSSGTTGTPKIVPLATSQLLATARSVVDAHQLGASDCGYSPLPLFHINGLVVGILSTVLTGGRLVVDRRFSASTFWEIVEANRATWLNLVPGIITVLGQVPPPEPGQAGTVRFARSASAPLPVSALLRFEEHCAVPVIETYGMTEAASQITANPLVAPRAGSVGCPVGIELRVVGPDRVPLAPDAVGEVEIRGPSVVERYWAPVGTEPPSRTATHADGWLSTGDLGSLDEDGYLSLLGRIDDVINRGGEKVHPREVEEVLLQDPAVGAAVVIGRPHPIVGEEPVAIVVMSPGHSDQVRLTARLHQRCDRELSRYKRPVAITVASQLPAGATGKVNRREVRRASVPTEMERST